jgi:RimJ/RimL family protein N-acetyltransferase
MASVIQLEEIRSERLVLVPIPGEQARSFLGGDLSSVTPGEGWPHADTFDGLRIAVEHGRPAGWLVTSEGCVIGDCGTHGLADPAGSVEIGYGLAAPWRGHGYGSELVAAMSSWLLEQAAVTSVVAATSPDNAASRRILEKNGFTVVGVRDEGLVVYQRDR